MSLPGVRTKDDQVMIEIAQAATKVRLRVVQRQEISKDRPHG